CILAIDRHATTFRHRMHQGEYQGPGSNVRLAGGDLDRYRVNGDGADADIGLQLAVSVRGLERFGRPRFCEVERKRVDTRLQGEPDLHFHGWHSSHPLRPRGLSGATWQWRVRRSAHPADY